MLEWSSLKLCRDGWSNSIFSNKSRSAQWSSRWSRFFSKKESRSAAANSKSMCQCRRTFKSSARWWWGRTSATKEHQVNRRCSRVPSHEREEEMLEFPVPQVVEQFIALFDVLSVLQNLKDIVEVTRLFFRDECNDGSSSILSRCQGLWICMTSLRQWVGPESDHFGQEVRINDGCSPFNGRTQQLIGRSEHFVSLSKPEIALSWKSIQDRILSAPQVLVANDETGVKEILQRYMQHARFNILFECLHVESVWDGKLSACPGLYTNTGYRKSVCVGVSSVKDVLTEIRWQKFFGLVGDESEDSVLQGRRWLCVHACVLWVASVADTDFARRRVWDRDRRVELLTSSCKTELKLRMCLRR